MNVRGVEIEVSRLSAADASAEMAIEGTDPAAASRGPATEQTVRDAFARGLLEAQVRSFASVALGAAEAGHGELTFIAAAKIMVQEAIRVARDGASALKRIVLCCPDESGFDIFSRTVTGYVNHFLNVLLWGPFSTVDAIIEVSAGIVLVQRKNPPLGFALPGGFVDYGESLEEAVVREAREETSLDLLDLEQFHTYSQPGRDARFHTITTVFTARAEGTPRAGDDAASIRTVTASEMESVRFAFDHRQVLQDYLTRKAGPTTVRGRRD